MVGIIISRRDVLISVISHGQGRMVHELLNDIEDKCDHARLSVVLTLNIDEDLPFTRANFSYPITIIKNNRIKGFAANHNYAFSLQKSKYFCVLNPDIRFIDDPFKCLAELADENAFGILAPLVYNRKMEIEDNIRRLPTPASLLKRFIKKKPEYSPASSTMEVDWAAGMFLVFYAKVFEQLGGFDEKYYLYCEDIDICSRSWLMGSKVLWATDCRVIHEAQRTSHKKLGYFLIHLISYIKLFCSNVYYRRLLQKYR